MSQINIFKMGEISVLSEFIDVWIVEDIQKLNSQGICSIMMFDMAALYAKRALVMFYTDLIALKKV